MEAGRELDTLMAEALGWKLIHRHPVDCWSYYKDGLRHLKSIYWSPSTGDKAALELVDSLIASGQVEYLILYVEDGQMSVDLYPKEGHCCEGKAETRPHAVCLAVLELMKEKDEKTDC